MSSASKLSKIKPSKNSSRPKQGRIDMFYLVFILILLIVGLVMLFSASYVYSYYYEKGDSFWYIRRQAIFAVLGVIAMFVVSRFDYHIFHWLAVPIMVFTVGLLVFTVILRYTIYSGRITRWIRLGFIQFQPSEIAKFAVIILFSQMACMYHKDMKTFKKGILPFAAVLGMICVLMLLEPHMSGTILIVLIGASLMLIGGSNFKFFAVAGGIGAAALLAVLLLFDGLTYAKQRLVFYIDPFADPKNQGYQIIQSMYAIASGGLLGKGLGNSRQKFLYLPEPQNDFIFAIVCEELGMVGAVLIIVLFMVFIWRGLHIALHAKDLFGTMIAAGITIQFGLQAMFNMMVVTKTIPNTGISLPFFSYGGTALMMLLGEMGIVLNISRSSTLEKPS